MTVVRRMNPVNRLAALIHKPGGLKMSQAVAAAERNLEGVRDEALARLDEIIASLDADAAGRTTYDADAADRMYGLANEIVGVAGVFGYGPMGDAAYSLCELLDQLRTRETWSVEGVAVHLQTLKLLRSSGGPTADPATCAAILAGLRQVSARVVRGPGEPASGAAPTA